MRFELNDLLMDEIVFYMENQESNFVLDTQELHICEEKPELKEDRYIPIPQWEPKDGYRLMGKFAASLKNPVVRQELGEALNRNKGVFRAYRNVLEQYPETEKLWFKYKDQNMKNEVVVWYNVLREGWGLEPVGSEPEDNSSLVLEDFVFKDGGNIFCQIAESAGGETAGSISAEIIDSALHIKNIEVKPVYRGMGIGKTLVAKLLEKADEQKLDVTIDLPAETDFFTRSLLLENFKLFTQRFIRKFSS